MRGLQQCRKFLNFLETNCVTRKLHGGSMIWVFMFEWPKISLGEYSLANRQGLFAYLEHAKLDLIQQPIRTSLSTTLFKHGQLTHVQTRRLNIALHVQALSPGKNKLCDFTCVELTPYSGSKIGTSVILQNSAKEMKDSSPCHSPFSHEIPPQRMNAYAHTHAVTHAF